MVKICSALYRQSATRILGVPAATQIKPSFMAKPPQHARMIVWGYCTPAREKMQAGRRPFERRGLRCVSGNGGRSFALALPAALALTPGPAPGPAAAGTAVSALCLGSGGSLLPRGSVGGGVLLRGGLAGGSVRRLFHLLRPCGAGLPGLVLPRAL